MAQCKSFVSEAELAERRIRRQEEWEKVRKPEDPLEAPEEEYDPRSLYERLQEQKGQKQAEYEEAHRLKNMIRGLDDDEVEFLDLVDRTKEKIEAQRWKEEITEIQEFRKAVANLAEKNAEQRLLDLKKEVKTHLVNSSGVKKSQSSLLTNAVKRKNCDTISVPEKRLKLNPKGGAEEACKYLQNHKESVNKDPFITDNNNVGAENSNLKEEIKGTQKNQETATISEDKNELSVLDLKKERDSQHVISSSMVATSTLLPTKGVKRKPCDGEPSNIRKIVKLDNYENNLANNSTKFNEHDSDSELNTDSDEIAPLPEMESQVCIGVLPGLGVYSDSSDSDNSSASEEEETGEFDLVGRRRLPKVAYDALMKYMKQNKIKCQLRHCRVHWS